MGFFDKEKTSSLTVKSPQEIFTELMRLTSGAKYSRNVDFNIFYQIVAFKGIIDGVGTSTIVANTAIAIAKLGLTVCVIDSSVLNPVQDVLLNTNWRDVEVEKRKDWFDMMYTDESVLNKSKINSNISVLSFKGTNRDITDIMGTKDSDLLVETALSILHNKFDIILIDCCQETTQINAGCLQQAQKVIQVWSDTPHIVSNINNWITNNVILSCPLDKMRYVVISKYVSDIHCDFTGMLNQYRFTKLTSCCLSPSIARVNATGKVLWQFPSDNEHIIEFNNCIIDIVCHLLNIEDEKSINRGTFTSNDIEEGKVDGTLHKKIKSKRKDTPEVITTIEDADKSLESTDDPNLLDDYMQEYSDNINIESDEENKTKKHGFFKGKRG